MSRVCLRMKTSGGLLLLVFVVLAVCCRYTQTHLEGWDTLAYLVAAERIAAGESPAYCHPYNESIGPYFTMAGFNVRGPDPKCLYLNYPPGYPLLLAMVARVLRMPAAMLYVPAVLAAVGVALVYAIGDLLFDPRVGLTAALLVGSSPLYLRFATSPWSDLPVAVLQLAGLSMLIWAERQPSTVRRAVGAALAALLIGWGILSRYSAAVFLLPVSVYWLAGRPISATLKAASTWAFSLMIVLVMVAIGLYNRANYGGALMTPYSSQHGWYSWSMFSWRYLLGSSPAGSGSLLAVFETLWGTYGLLLFFGCVGALALARRSRALLLSGLGCLALFQGFYAFPARGINARFLIPILPFTALLIAVGIRHSGHGSRAWAGVWRGLAILMIALQLIVTLPSTLGSLDERNRHTIAYADAVRSMGAATAPESVFLAYHLNDAISYYGDRVPLFYRRMVPGKDAPGDLESYFELHLVTAVSALLDQGVPVYYVLDTDPPYMNSLAVLREHFHVVAFSPDAILFQVTYLAP